MNGCIGIVAPSSGIEPERLELLGSYLGSHGFEIKFQDDILGDDLFYANTDQKRAEGLISVLSDPEVDVVWSVMGGRGASSIMSCIDKENLDLEGMNTQKKYVGFSDSTVILLWLYKNFNIDAVIHGPVAAQLVGDHISEDSKDFVLSLLKGEEEGKVLFYDVKAMFEEGAFPKNELVVSGGIVGGNLTLIESSIATPWQLSFADKVLLLEDINVYPYSVERSLVHFEQAGVFEEVKAVIFGDFVLPDLADSESALHEVFMRFQQRVKFPVFKVKGIGHSKENRAFIYGSNVLVRCLGDSFSLEMTY